MLFKSQNPIRDGVQVSKFRLALSKKILLLRAILNECMDLPKIINRKNIYFFGLFLMVVALPLSKFLMSVAQLGIVSFWLIDPAILQKFKAFFKNRAAVIVVSLFLLHVIGLLWTTDFDYAIKDLRTKIPILALPVIISTSPKLSRKQFHLLMVIFLAANVIGSFFSMHELLTKDLTEIRKVSIFISHIRFGLNICVAIFAGVFLVIKGDCPNYIKAMLVLAISWLLVFLVIIESMTGLMVVFIVAIILVVIWVFKQKNLTARLALIAVLIVVPIVLFVYIRSIYLETLPKEELNLSTLDKKTDRGNIYYIDTNNLIVENGYYVGIYIQNEELREAWNERSRYDFDGHDSIGQVLKYTLYRFLTSKGLRKDYNGVQKLSNEEIWAVEKGIANIDQMVESSIRTRIKTIFWEFRVYFKQGHFSGHSVTQRIEFWHASLRIIDKHFWFGTGTGDIDNAFRVEYDEMKTSLSQKVRWRSHNQYLSIFVAFGVTGFILFIYVLFAPALITKMYRDYFYAVFMMILLLSMLTEDTLESQAGVTFYAFLTSFFLFARTGPEPLFSQGLTREK